MAGFIIGLHRNKEWSKPNWSHCHNTANNTQKPLVTYPSICPGCWLILPENPEGKIKKKKKRKSHSERMSSVYHIKKRDESSEGSLESPLHHTTVTDLPKPSPECISREWCFMTQQSVLKIKDYSVHLENMDKGPKYAYVFWAIYHLLLITAGK